MTVPAMREIGKMARYAASFAARRLVHTNLQLLYDCNLSCRICDFWEPKWKAEPRLSLAQVEVIARKLAAIGPQIISIGGGEPLLHPELAGIVRALSRRHFPVMICNGWYVTPDNARALFEAGAYEVSVSVDYADRAKHDRQRGVDGAFDRAISALEILNRSRVNPHQRVHMISVVMDDNLDEIEPLIRLSRRMGITYLVTLYSDARGAKESRAIPADVSRRLLALKSAYPEFVALRGYVAQFSRAVRDGGIGPCRAGANLCNIDSRGNMALCIDRMDDPVGNILMDGPEVLVRRLREKVRTNACRDCWTSCRGSIETLMYGPARTGNLWDYYQMARSVGIGEPFNERSARAAG